MRQRSDLVFVWDLGASWVAVAHWEWFPFWRSIWQELYELAYDMRRTIFFLKWRCTCRIWIWRYVGLISRRGHTFLTEHAPALHLGRLPWGLWVCLIGSLLRRCIQFLAGHAPWGLWVCLVESLVKEEMVYFSNRTRHRLRPLSLFSLKLVKEMVYFFISLTEHALHRGLWVCLVESWLRRRWYIFLAEHALHWGLWVCLVESWLRRWYIFSFFWQNTPYIEASESV